MRDGTVANIILKELRDVFNPELFDIVVKIARVTDQDDEEDMFLRYASRYVSFQVIDKSTKESIALVYILEEGRKLVWYVSSADFESYPGMKYGTKLVGVILKTGLTNTVRISDRSEIIPEYGHSVWQHIVNKYTDIEYEEV